MVIEQLDLTVKETGQYGKGVFTLYPRNIGEIILYIMGEVYDYDDIEDGSELDKTCIQIDQRKYRGKSGKFDDFLNHSCNPNTGLILNAEKIALVAIRDIKAGEEITFDYSTCIEENHWEMDCLCGSSNCRGRIQDFSLLPKSLQQKYLKLGIVLPFIAKQYIGVNQAKAG